MPPVTFGDRKRLPALPGIARVGRTHPRRMLLRGQAGRERTFTSTGINGQSTGKQHWGEQFCIGLCLMD